MNNFFKRPDPPNDFNVIYTKLKSLDKKMIIEEIDTNFNRFGVDYLDAMILNSVLDIDSDKSSESYNRMISFIEKYSLNLINK